MESREIRKLLEETLTIENYTITDTDTQAFVIESDNKKIILSYNKYPDSLILSPGLIGMKAFDEVETILSKYILTEEKGKPNIATIYTQSQRLEDIKTRTISSKNDISVVANLYRGFIKRDIIPFFDKYDNLEEVYLQLNTLEKSEVSRFIYTPPVPRLMIIKRLMNDLEWEEFCEWAITIYEKMAMGPHKAQHAQVFAFLPDLYEELKNLDPLKLSQPPAV